MAVNLPNMQLSFILPGMDQQYKLAKKQLLFVSNFNLTINLFWKKLSYQTKVMPQSNVDFPEIRD